MHECPFCKTNCDYIAGDLAFYEGSDNFVSYPVYKNSRSVVEIVNPKCLFSYKNNRASVHGHDYVCKTYGTKNKLTYPVTGDRLSKIEDPNDILKEIL